MVILRGKRCIRESRSCTWYDLCCSTGIRRQCMCWTVLLQEWLATYSERNGLKNERPPISETWSAAPLAINNLNGTSIFTWNIASGIERMCKSRFGSSCPGYDQSLGCSNTALRVLTEAQCTLGAPTIERLYNNYFAILFQLQAFCRFHQISFATSSARDEGWKIVHRQRQHLSSGTITFAPLRTASWRNPFTEVECPWRGWQER